MQALPYSLATFLRRIELPEEKAQWWLTSAQLNQSKIGVRVVHYTRSITFQLGELVISHPLVRVVLAAVGGAITAAKHWANLPQTEQKWKDGYVHCAEKHRLWSRTRRFRGLTRHVPEAGAVADAGWDEKCLSCKQNKLMLPASSMQVGECRTTVRRSASNLGSCWYSEHVSHN